MAAREKNFLGRYRSKNVNLPLHRMHILLIHFQEYPSVNYLPETEIILT